MTAVRSTAPSSTVSIEPQNDALFNTVRSALAFAYSIVHFPIASSPKLGPTVGSSGRLSSLSPQEKHAQGALIRLAAEQRLSGIDVAVTFAFYGTGEVRTAAILEVSREVAKQIRREGLGIELAMRYFLRSGQQKSHSLIAHEFGVSRQTVDRLYILVSMDIERLRMATEQRLEGIFVSTGISKAL